jgi:hypothetical protein
MRGSGADRLAHGQCDQVADAQRRREREGRTAAGCDGVEIQRNLHANHGLLFFVRIEELPAGEDNRLRRMFGSVPADVLVETVERLVSKMDEGDLARDFRRDLEHAKPGVGAAFVEALLDAFRQRGESSEDAAEGAGTSIEAIERCDGTAVDALLAYALANPGALRAAAALFVRRRPDLAAALPEPLRGAVARRLARA